MMYILSATITNDKHLQVCISKCAPYWVHVYFCNKSLTKKAAQENNEVIFYIMD